MQVRVRPEARADLELIAAYYGKEDEALRRRFLARVDQVFDRLSMFPSAAPVVFANARRALVPEFPYGVFYRIRSGDIVQVLAIQHLHREPSTWERRVATVPDDE